MSKRYTMSEIAREIEGRLYNQTVMPNVHSNDQSYRMRKTQSPLERIAGTAFRNGWPHSDGIVPKLNPYLQVQNDNNKTMPNIQRQRIEDLELDFAKLIYSSNFIEQVGLYKYDFTYTWRICKMVFRQMPEAPDPYKREFCPEIIPNCQYQQFETWDNLINSILQECHATWSEIKEVIQHAEALEFLVDRILIRNAPFTQSDLLETHRLLHRGIPISGEEIAGKIRTHRVGAKSFGKTVQFTPPSGIPQMLQNLFDDLIEDIDNSLLVTKTIDPYDFAASYCHRFVNIHPFADGNGRVCRLLLNVLLLKFAGHVVWFGGDEVGREEYLGIAHKGARDERREELNEVGGRDRVSHRGLAGLVLRCAREQAGLPRWGGEQVVVGDNLEGKGKGKEVDNGGEDGFLTKVFHSLVLGD